MSSKIWKKARVGYALLKKLSNHTAIKRTILTEAYRCQDVWMQRLQSPVFQNVDINDFLVQMRERFDLEGKTSVIDMDILANKADELYEEDIELAQNLLSRFRHTEDSFPMRESISHAFVRAFMKLNQTDKLLQMIKDRVNTGIIPDFHAASILMDHFIKKQNFKDAAQVAYELMLQEDFSHPISFLLSLYATTKHYIHSPPQKPEPPPPDDGEEEWVRVPYILPPFYDDHFDIKDERFLLGKTIHMLGKHVGNTTLGQSLQILGSGMYDKFELGLRTLEFVSEDSVSGGVLKESVDKFRECLETTDVRDPDVPEVELAKRTLDDEIEQFRITEAERTEFIARLKHLEDKLQSSNKILTDSLETQVEDFVSAEIPKYEEDDISVLKEKLETWNKERQELVDEQVKDYLKKQKMREIEQKLFELQEKEELLNYFEFAGKIKQAYASTESHKAEQQQ